MVRGSGGNYSAQCPSHADDRASLCITENGNGDALLFCQAGCGTDKVVASINLRMSDLFAGESMAIAGDGGSAPHVGANGSANSKHHAGGRTNGAIDYEVRDIAGAVVAVHHRRTLPDGGKTMWWSRPGVPKGLGGMRVQDIPLYGTHLLPAAPPEVPRIIVEGEKSATALQLRSLLALSTVTGASKTPSADVLACLAGSDVVLWPDNDEPGRMHMLELAVKLRGVAKSVRIVDLTKWDGIKPKDDAADFRGTDDELCALLDLAPPAPEPSAGDGTASGTAGNELRIFDPKQPLIAARAFVSAFYSHPDGPTMRSYGGVSWIWRNNRYVEAEDEFLGSQLQPWLTASACHGKEDKLEPYPATSQKVTDVLQSARRHVHLPITTTTPAWLGAEPAPYPLHELLPCRSATLHIPSGETIAPTPNMFAFNALDYDYDPAAPDPVRWYAFMRTVFDGDDEQVQLLQEWFGYVLTADTRKQKILLVVGPPRSGKGTIARVLTQLIGPGNVTGPTVSSLAGTFGMAPLLGKSLAIISDARFAGEGVALAIDLLKNISGEDAVSVNRKNKDAPTVTLPTRFTILANENPRLPDASAAIASRFLVLRTSQSFLGREDHNLTADLLAELPGILLWAIHGWHRLNERGYFLEPESSRQTVQDIGDLSSPVSAFIRERCVVGTGQTVLTRALYAAWQGWCKEEGHSHITTAAIFGKDLAACVPGLRKYEGAGRERFYAGLALK